MTHQERYIRFAARYATISWACKQPHNVALYRALADACAIEAASEPLARDVACPETERADGTE
jgi:hypothetical protein